MLFQFEKVPDFSQSRTLLYRIERLGHHQPKLTVKKPTALYGAGELGCLARSYMKSMGQDFVIVMDKYAQFLPEPLADLGLYRPRNVSPGFSVAVAVTSVPYSEIEQDLKAEGFTDIIPFYDLTVQFRHRHPLNNGWFAGPLTPYGVEQILKVLETWADDASRAQHIQFLAWRRLRQDWAFADAPVQPKNRFFIPEITKALGKNEVFVDCGAHHGGVVDSFIAQVGGSCYSIVAIEPDRFNRKFLDGKATTILDCALSNGDGHSRFCEGLGYMSQLSSLGEVFVETRALDNLGIFPSFIKLHLEGGELAALEGAVETLRDCRPIVAVTVYHNSDGLWKTPLWLMETLPEYKFLFRLHNWCGTGAVVYAIPNERWT